MLRDTIQTYRNGVQFTCILFTCILGYSQHNKFPPYGDIHSLVELNLAIYLSPGDTIRAYRAPVVRFYFLLKTQVLVFKTANWSTQLGWAVIETNFSGFTGDPTCVLLLPIDLSLGKRDLEAVMFT